MGSNFNKNDWENSVGLRKESHLVHPKEKLSGQLEVQTNY